MAMTKAQLALALSNAEAKIEELSASLIARGPAPAAQDSIAAAHSELHDEQTCPKCNGTGTYTSSTDGRTGDCFHCKGKGFVTARDVRRNSVYSYHRELQALIQRHALKGYLSPRQIPLEEKRGKQVVQHDNYWYAIP